jgi:hypothetical protein
MNSNVSLPTSRDFWADIAPCEHLVQIYPGDTVFLDALESFVSAGFEKGEAIVLIATPEHLDALQRRLRARGFDLDAARERALYITLDADESLQKFMIRGWPDESLFQHFVHRIVERAGARRIRAFGEMVALLWARGQGGAMLRLEQLWHKICQRDGLALLCAYPRNGFTHDADNTIRDICATHSCVIDWQ